jgi:GDPmannose 4,6-dehydratase
LGNLDALRDWGHAKDYVEAMWLMLQQPEPQDLVVATGIETTVRNLAEMAFSEIGISLEFRGDASRERGLISSIDSAIFEERAGTKSPEWLIPGAQVIAVDPNYYRPAEVPRLCGDASRARNILGWSPKYDVRTMIGEMVQADLKALV